MSANLLPEVNFTYTQEESLDMLIHSVKANHDCQTERKTFNLCRANILGKYVDPNFCFEKGSHLINCFQTVRKDEKVGCKEKYNVVKECATKSSNKFFSTSCQNDLNEYLSC